MYSENIMKSAGFWAITVCNFGRTVLFDWKYRFPFQGRNLSQENNHLRHATSSCCYMLMMLICSSGISGFFWPYNCAAHCHRDEWLKGELYKFVACVSLNIYLLFTIYYLPGGKCSTLKFQITKKSKLCRLADTWQDKPRCKLWMYLIEILPKIVIVTSQY